MTSGFAVVNLQFCFDFVIRGFDVFDLLGMFDMFDKIQLNLI